MRTRTEAPSRPWPVRLAWLLAFWIAGVGVMGAVAVLLRWVMALVGLAG